MRRRFDGNTYFSFEQTENAIRATRINELLDAGKAVVGDDGPDSPGKEHELDEAIQPHANGIDCRTKAGEVVRIFAYEVR